MLDYAWITYDRILNGSVFDLCVRIILVGVSISTRFVSRIEFKSFVFHVYFA